MSLKRKREKTGDSRSEKEVRKDRNGAPLVMNDYGGFSLQHDEQAIIPVESGTISPRDFFVNYIAERSPCVIDALPKLESGKFPSFSIGELNKVAGEEEVQVEKRHSPSESFGQNRTASRQLIMTVSEFLKNLEDEKNGDLLYLSTQESDNEDAFQVPCLQLLENGLIAAQVPWAGNLVLHSCNLWIGTSRDGSTSSGLHHDYHDNFYLLIRGTKRFRLYSPDCASCMYVYGEIEQVFPNGMISYVGSETRADGVPVGALDRNNDGDSEEHDETEDEEEEGVFFGEGFDYRSDSESIDETKDDFDEIMAKDDEADEATETAANSKEASIYATQRPNSFSKIDVETLQDPASITEKFPQFARCRECIVELKEGQTLYLPAGWFHEVTSGTVPKGANHTALNYWYHPPDSVDKFEQPYAHHEFWREEAKAKKERWRCHKG